MQGAELTTTFEQDKRFDALVSATSRREAVAIAAEAMPAECTMVYVEVADVALHEGKDSWQVAIWFARCQRALT